MAFSLEEIEIVFDRTDGRCHLCRRKLAFRNYGSLGRRRAWEIDHSVPRARGGTGRINNLLPACVACNRSKRDAPTKTIRLCNGFTAAPLSKCEQRKRRSENAAAGATVCALIGVLAAGPAGLALCAAAGGFAAYQLPVE
jgi:hypothetical protein